VTPNCPVSRSSPQFSGKLQLTPRMTSGRLSEKDGTTAALSLVRQAVSFNEIEHRFCCILLRKSGSASTRPNHLVDCVYAITWP
jgi:hypothetical protein